MWSIIALNRLATRGQAQLLPYTDAMFDPNVYAVSSVDYRQIDQLKTKIPETEKYIEETATELKEVSKAEEELGGKVRSYISME